MDTGAPGLGGLTARDGRRRPKSRVTKGSARGTVYGRSGGSSVGSVGLALRGRGPRASGRKLRGTKAGGAWICTRAAG